MILSGPFRADVMQKWYDEGYFNATLLMKRTHIDPGWTSVGDLLRTANGGKVFLSQPLRPAPTPALEPQFTAPLEPIPRAIRTTTLDSYFQTGSNASDSPTSSFGAGRFSNNSPDPLTLTGRGNLPFQQAPGANAYNGLNTVEPLRRAFEESFDISGNGRPFGGYSPARANQVDPLMYNGAVFNSNDHCPMY